MTLLKFSREELARGLRFISEGCHTPERALKQRCVDVVSPASTFRATMQKCWWQTGWPIAYIDRISAMDFST